MKFLTGISLETWLKIGISVAFAVLAFVCHQRGNTIDDLRQSLANERAAHDVTRASLKSVQGELIRQNEEIDRQRAASDQAKHDLAAAIELSAGSQDIVDRLTSSSRSAPAGAVCDPSETTRRIWQ